MTYCDVSKRIIIYIKGKLMDTNKLLLIIIAILLPPVAVFLKHGMGKDLLINVVLCLLFYFPGLLHALWVVTKA